MFKNLLYFLVLCPACLLANYSIEKLQVKDVEEVLAVSRNGHVLCKENDNVTLIYPSGNTFRIGSKNAGIRSAVVNDEGVVAAYYRHSSEEVPFIWDTKKNIFKHIPAQGLSPSYWIIPEILMISGDGEVYISFTKLTTGPGVEDTLVLLYKSQTNQAVTYPNKPEFFYREGNISRAKYSTSDKFFFDRDIVIETVDEDLAAFLLVYTGNLIKNDIGEKVGIQFDKTFLWRDDGTYTLYPSKIGKPVALNNNSSVLFVHTSYSLWAQRTYSYLFNSQMWWSVIEGAELHALNDREQAVGAVHDSISNKAVVWDAENGIQDLNERLAPSSLKVHLFDAINIDNQGRILAKGWDGSQGDKKTKFSLFVLTPE